LDHILLTSIFLIFDDETLPTINKPKHPKKKRGNMRNKMEGPTSKKTIEPPKMPNQQGERQVPGPPPVVARSISNNERGGPPETRPSLEKPSPTATAHLKIETACTHIVIMSLTLSAY